MHRLRIVVLVVVLTGLAAWGVTAYVRSTRTADGPVEASGTIEATEVSVASKLPGRIARINAGEGDIVKAGTALVTIEGKELTAQVDQARAAIDAAKARVAQATAGLALQIRQVDAQIAQAQAQVETARTREQQATEIRTITSAQTHLAVRQAEAARAAARATSTAAKATLDRTTSDLARVEALYREGAVSGQQLDAARAASRAAQAQFDASQDAVRQADAALQLATENLRQVELRERDVAAARSQVRQTEAQLSLARAGQELIAQRRADIAAAEAAQRQAEANLRYLLAQQQNLIITAPLSGVVITKHASEGEIVGAGAPILTIADLDEVWIRLYIPLPKLGRVPIGQRAEVTTDALPGRTFTGTVTEISQQAEFTPRNVQTREERVKLVFAVKVTLPNPEHLLKPGMPADATIAAR